MCARARVRVRVRARIVEHVCMACPMSALVQIQRRFAAQYDALQQQGSALQCAATCCNVLQILAEDADLIHILRHTYAIRVLT